MFNVLKYVLCVTLILSSTLLTASCASDAPHPIVNTPEPAVPPDTYNRDEEIASFTSPSTDLTADLKTMWQTRHTSGQGTGVPAERRFASTFKALNAASRVFNTIDLKGLTRDQVIAKLGSPRTSSNSIYNFPFYPPKPGDLVYRFDTGSGGWQFNIHFDTDAKVHSVERLQIR